MSKVYDVGIIGGGVSGVVTALQLANLGIDCVLFEQEKSVVNGPPFCHLHAGGNLYPDISDEQCKLLMKQSIEMARLFPQSIDERPTLISIPKTEKYKVSILEQRLKMLEGYYRELVSNDPANGILGIPNNYYRIYTKENLDDLAKIPPVKKPNTPDEWMSNAMSLIDGNQLKTPVILVQEYGWNLFRLGAQAQLALQQTTHCDLKLNSKIKHIKDVRSNQQTHNWEVNTGDTTYKLNYLVNSCGFKSGELDEFLQLNMERLIEFKAAYVSKWKPITGLIPELVFYGERGTPHGMAQLTPYCDDYYQIHGMTEDITLFKEGVVQAKKNDPQPKFNNQINHKLTHGWEKSEVNSRTENAIRFVSKFVPSFTSAIVGGPPLYGAQQIPGDDLSLRVGEVSFPTKSYARSEIVKASSALVVANEIIGKIQEEKIISPINATNSPNKILANISPSAIDLLAAKLAVERGYPKALSRLVIDKK